MAERTRGMGRGLSAILSSTVPADEGGAGGDRHPELREIPLELIAPNPRQPRREFDEAALLALAESLRERGVLQPVLLRPVPGGTYELIAGERRWRAAQIAGFERVPAVVRAHDDAASLELALIENMAREDLNPVEEARACALLVEELGLTREDVGRRVGRSRVAVSNLLRILDLPDDVLDLLTDGHAQRGPRARAADGLRPRGPAPARPRRRRRGLDGPPHRGAGPRGRGPRAGPRSGAPAARPGSTRTRRRPPAGSATPSGGCSAPTSGSPRAATATRSRWPSTRSTRRWRWRSAWGPSNPPDTARNGRYHRAAGAISSVG